MVNVARGHIIDEASLFNALRDHTIAGAAIDVWYNYNPGTDETGRCYPFSHPFHTLQNVILSPHRSASPLDDLQRWDEVVENIKRHAAGRDAFLNVIDLNDEY